MGTPVTGNEDQLSNCRRVSAFLGRMQTINMSHLHKHTFLYTTRTQRREGLLRNTFQQVLQDTNKLRSGRTLAVCSHLASGLRGVAPRGLRGSLSDGLVPSLHCRPQVPAQPTPSPAQVSPPLSPQ